MTPAEEIHITTKHRTELCDITPRLQSLVSASKVSTGVLHIFVPHTTAGVTINENADPSVKQDLLNALEKIVPAAGEYEHTEGNADAHIKSTLVGTDRTVFIEEGRLKLGTWQGVFLCEFDGPRQRTVFAKIT